MVAITLTPEHGLVVLAAAGLVFTHMLIGGIVSAARKKAFGKAFKEQPAVQALFEEHKKSSFGSTSFCPDGAHGSDSSAPSTQQCYAQVTRTWETASSGSCFHTRCGVSAVAWKAAEDTAAAGLAHATAHALAHALVRALLTHAAQEWLKFNNAQRAHHNLLENSASVYACLFGAGVFYPATAAKLGAIFCVGRLVYAYGYVRGGPSGRLYGSLLSHVGDLGLFGCMINGGGKLAGWW